MKTLSMVFAVVLGLLAMAGGAQAAVMRVVVVQTTDVAAYTKELAQVQAHMTRLGGTATIRAWRARFAGSDTGSIVVSVEYKDMADFAAIDAKMRDDAANVATMKNMDAIRTIISDSLYDELK
ncbi:MAG TPA: hypothetical protein PLC02_14185 [Pseudomonadota bacterium]|nr:hypothetical protein [Pseudomonadota bacterium]HRA38838.1 hypothetical protein [Pseudomonadota bacterium]